MKNKLFGFFAAGILFFSCSDSELVNMKELSNGAKIYKNNCANCHQEDGSGLANLIPPLYHSDYLGKHASELPCIITKGMAGEISVNGKSYNMRMAAIHHLTKEELNDLCTYVLQKFPEQAIQPEVWKKSATDSCW
jgi:mono/diheme cytochrome c family protein